MITILRVGDRHTGDLPPTATYAARSWTFVPTPGAPDGRVGNLTIELLFNKPASGKVESDTYAVEEHEPLRGLMGRRFTLTNLTDPDAAEPYEVVLGPLGRCGCMAGQCRAKQPEPCKHVAALRVLAAGNVLPDPSDPRGGDALRSGLCFEDAPGEPTAAEPAAHA